MKRLVFLLLIVQVWIFAQDIPVPLRSRIVNGITSIATVIDNRSNLYLESEHTFCATGSGTWSAVIQHADGTPTSWTSFTGAAATVSNTSLNCVGLGMGYHDFIRFSLTGTVSVNYAGTSFIYLPNGGLTTTLPISDITAVPQGVVYGGDDGKLTQDTTNFYWNDSILTLGFTNGIIQNASSTFFINALPGNDLALGNTNVSAAAIKIPAGTANAIFSSLTSGGTQCVEALNTGQLQLFGAGCGAGGGAAVVTITGGGGGAYTGTCSPTCLSLSTGTVIEIPTFSIVCNGLALTLNLDGLGAKRLYTGDAGARFAGPNLTDCDTPVTGYFQAVSNGSALLIQGISTLGLVTLFPPVIAKDGTANPGTFAALQTPLAVADLPSASVVPFNNVSVQVLDGTGPGDCTVGGGNDHHWCYPVAGVWTAYPGGGATIPSTTSALKGDGAGNAAPVTGTGTNCVLVNGSSAACSSGGASSVSQLTDCQFIYTSTTVITMSGCNALINGVVVPVSPSTLTVSGSTGLTGRFYISDSTDGQPAGTLVAANTAAAGLACSACHIFPSTSAFGSGIILGSWTALSVPGNWDMSGLIDTRSLSSAMRLQSGNGNCTVALAGASGYTITCTGGSSGASSVSQLTDCQFIRTSATVLTMNACNASINGAVFPVAGSTFTVSGSTGLTGRFYITDGTDGNSAGNLVVSNSAAAGVACSSCNVVPSTATFGSGIKLASWTALSVPGNWDVTVSGLVDFRGLSSAMRLQSGNGNCTVAVASSSGTTITCTGGTSTGVFDIYNGPLSAACGSGGGATTQWNFQGSWTIEAVCVNVGAGGATQTFPLTRSTVSGDTIGYTFTMPTNVTALNVKVSGFTETATANTLTWTTAVGCLANIGGASAGGTPNTGTASSITSTSANTTASFTFAGVSIAGCNAQYQAYLVLTRTGTYSGNYYISSIEINVTRTLP